MTLDIDVLNVFTAEPPRVPQAPSWALPRPSELAGRDGLSQGRILVGLAMSEMRDGHQPEVEEAVARLTLTYGAAALRGGAFEAKAAAGMTLFAAHLAAQTLRRTCTAHPEVRGDRTLLGLFDTALAQLFSGGRPRPPSGDPQPGLALLRHIERLQYTRDVHPALETFARTTASPANHLYQAHLRKLFSAVTRHHLSTQRRMGQDSVLVQALQCLLPGWAPDTDTASSPAPTCAGDEPGTDAVLHPLREPAQVPRPPRPDRVDEAYLWRLCEYLTEHRPRVPGTGRTWLQSARLWARRPGQPGTDRLLDVPTMDLYQTVDQAGLPLPTDQELNAAAAACDNALAVVLSGYAALRQHGGDHSAQIGKSVGTVLGTTRRSAAELTLSLLQRQKPEGYRRLLRHLADSRGQVDLRTLAALAYVSAGSRAAARLHSNPTGHWPAAGMDGPWEPVIQIAREFYTAQGRGQRPDTAD